MNPHCTSQTADWFAGGSHPYMTFVHCMNHDWLWILVTVGLNLLIPSGFGLHSSILAAKEMKGSLTARSDGPGKSAVFTMQLPREDLVVAARKSCAGEEFS
jgi:hypothetical protein